MDITTLATVPAMLAIVELLKRLGLPAKSAMPVTVVLSVALGLAQTFLGGDPVYQAAAKYLLMGLGACGLYDAAKIASPTVEQKNTLDTTVPRRAEAPEVTA